MYFYFPQIPILIQKANGKIPGEISNLQNKKTSLHYHIILQRRCQEINKMFDRSVL